MQRLQGPCSFRRETLDAGSWKCLELPNGAGHPDQASQDAQRN